MGALGGIDIHRKFFLCCESSTTGIFDLLSTDRTSRKANGGVTRNLTLLSPDFVAKIEYDILATW